MPFANQNKRFRPTALALAAGLCLQLAACGGDDDVPQVQTLTCADLNGRTVAAAGIGLPTTGAVVTSTQTVAASATVGEYCRVLGDINPVSASAPKIKFQLNLPTNWNNKAVMFGGGGYNGTIATGTGNVPAGPTDKPTPLGRGYATFGSDSGHQAGPAGSRDGSFGANDEALHNFGGDALKKTRDVAGALIEARYGSKAQRTYFAGGSTGGREALIAVSTWPQDFDGAIVLYPAWNATALDLQFGRVTRPWRSPMRIRAGHKRKLVFDAAVQACDGLDGVVDGLISNISGVQRALRSEHRDAERRVHALPGGHEAGDTCLSDAQIDTRSSVDQHAAGAALPARQRRDTYPGFNVWGTDFGIPDASPLQPTVLTLDVRHASSRPIRCRAVDATNTPPYGSTFWDQWVKYFVTRDAERQLADPRPAEPRHLAGSASSTLTGASRTPTAPTCRRFARQGRQDPDGARHRTTRWSHAGHRAVLRAACARRWAARAVADFMRYYEIPGYGHAISTRVQRGVGFADDARELGRERHRTAAQVVADTAAVPGRTRPLCEYPSWPRYNGSGDVNLAASFTCVTQ